MLCDIDLADLQEYFPETLDYHGTIVRFTRTSELKAILPRDAPFSLLSGESVGLWVHARDNEESEAIWEDAHDFFGLDSLFLRGIMDPSSCTITAWEWTMTLARLAQRSDLIENEVLPSPPTPWPRTCEVLYTGQGVIRITFQKLRPCLLSWDGVKMLQTVADVASAIMRLCELAAAVETNPEYYGNAGDGPKHFYEVPLGPDFRLRHRGLSVWETENAPLVEVGAERGIAVRQRGGPFYLVSLSEEENQTRSAEGQRGGGPWKGIEDAFNSHGDLPELKADINRAAEPILGILRAVRSAEEGTQQQGIEMVVGGPEYVTVRSRAGGGNVPSLRFRFEDSDVLMYVLDERDGASKWYVDGKEKRLRRGLDLRQAIENEVIQWWRDSVAAATSIAQNRPRRGGKGIKGRGGKE